MKTFAAVALLACVASAETDACKAWKSAAGAAYDCSSGTCKVKDSNANQVVKDAEATMTTAYKQICGDSSGASTLAAAGSLAVAAAALAF